jgi:hypothetical protein
VNRRHCSLLLYPPTPQPLRHQLAPAAYLVCSEADMPRMHDNVIVCVADACTEELAGSVACTQS